jgi:tRNA(His) 5'-end guanylyltransferase
MSEKSGLGDRMKGYEKISQIYLTRRTPVIIRVDGKAFHSFTRGMNKPFDEILIKSMWETAKYLCANLQGCKLAYVQSDEISILLTDYATLNTDALFDNNVQKIVSVSASMTTLAFNEVFRSLPFVWTDDYTEPAYMKLLNLYKSRYGKALFDSRVFVLPKEEVCNYFVWRQQDCTRNSIQMVAQANFSHRQLQGKDCNELQEILFQEKGINFNDLSVPKKRGVTVYKESYMKGEVQRSRWNIDEDIPIFTKDREYIEKLI